MVHFFGVLAPAFGARRAADEAPNKVDFFGQSQVVEAPSRAEQDALFLAGKRPEPAERSDTDLLRFVQSTLPPLY